MILFPYSGYRSKGTREANFRNILEECHGIDPHERPVVVLNTDTIRRGAAQAFLKEFGEGGPRSDDVEIVNVWSVDTCQMWLAGWGHILDTDALARRIVQVPGDIDLIREKKDFYRDLGNFLGAGLGDIIIGDFDAGDRFSAKNLIDIYGTLPLLANWFPDLSQKISAIPLSKPRSEFLNVERSTLEALLDHRKFAYEQTLNMLIHSWDDEEKDWIHTIKSHHCGEVLDDTQFRKYRDCLDQVERTERMLRLTWRELNEPKRGASQKVYSEFVDDYLDRDRRSTSIRETAVITIRNLIGPAEPVGAHVSSRSRMRSARRNARHAR
jgi:hypothetical protein